MNANPPDTRSTNLSLQAEAISLQPQAVVCPKCQHKRTAADAGPAWQCPKCGIAYNKATAQSDAVTHTVVRTAAARGKQETDHGDWDTATPGVVSLSFTGRIGRLRYMAYTWPIMALSAVGMAAAVLGPAHKTAPNVPLIIVVGILWFWLWLRLMALRLHDVNRSGKWLAALLLLPAVLAAVGGGQQMIGLGGGLFWIVALLLNIVPGTDGDNDYGPQPGPNTFLVKVGAALFIAFTAFAVYANIKYMEYVRSGKVQPSATLGNPGLTPSAFIGSWQGDGISLRVGHFADAVLVRLQGGQIVRTAGVLRVLDGNRISIGSVAPVILNVTMPPHVESKLEKVSLDGIELIKTQ